ncbi:NHLP leader peptide family RiPP precursor [Paenibacillus apiarius]|uniref:NHLP leader peptide family RiPP precursor n=1 Tax=Paenibacillus apiarius TaxID=46240 RepID=UPI0019809AA2|nr:NHLP leader peptide family RiPP precursor [Paenibacillus apiarius]MBN3525265.1 NHLP leader peptide family RiPP precursor [Paenibacillus apiarius]
MSTEQLVRNQIVQKAWEDPSFKQKLLSDPKSAIKEVLGISIPEHINMKAVEETADSFVLVIPPNPTDVITAGRVRMGYW